MNITGKLLISLRTFFCCIFSQFIGLYWPFTVVVASVICLLPQPLHEQRGLSRLGCERNLIKTTAYTKYLGPDHGTKSGIWHCQHFLSCKVTWAVIAHIAQGNVESQEPPFYWKSPCPTSTHCKLLHRSLCALGLTHIINWTQPWGYGLVYVRD